MQDVNVTYDKADNITAVENALPAPTPSLFTGYAAQTYGYDPYYRLKSARGTAGVAPDSTRTFTWDVELRRSRQRDPQGPAGPGGQDQRQGQAHACRSRRATPSTCVSPVRARTS